ncbi:MAG: sarcosine oxidase subunit gamma [Actinomycetes bacterium]
MTADLRRSPLAHRAGELAAVGSRSAGAVRIEELPFRSLLNLRLDPAGPAVSSAGDVLGVDLPLAPNTWAGTGDLAVLWLGPDEWLVVGPPGAEEELEPQLRAAAGDADVSVVVVSAHRTVLTVSGAAALDLLARGCALDLHPRVFPPGRCAQTMLARAQVVLVARPAGELWVLVRSSFADYLASWLLDAAVEYTSVPAS